VTTLTTFLLHFSNSFPTFSPQTYLVTLSQDLVMVFLISFFFCCLTTFLLEMFVDFGDFHNMDLDLSFLHFLDNFLGLFDNFGCTIFSSFLADFLDEFSGFLFNFSFVDFQARFVADFDIT